MVAKTAIEKAVKSSDFVVVSRGEYEALLRLKKIKNKRPIDVPLISAKEQRDIEKRYGEPIRRSVKTLRLNKLAEEGLKEYRVGKTELLDSFLKREYPRLYQKYAR